MFSGKRSVVSGNQVASGKVVSGACPSPTTRGPLRCCVQGGCGSCWAFSATETVESHYQIASGKLLTLAPQTFVDCVQNPQSCGGTGGCEGATMEVRPCSGSNPRPARGAPLPCSFVLLTGRWFEPHGGKLAFNLTIKKGMALETDLPYRAQDGACPAYKAAVKATGYVKNPVNDASALETAIATKGPMSVTVAAMSWQLYGGGIFDSCSQSGGIGPFKRHGDNTLDHGVQAVGYTSDYWIVRPPSPLVSTSMTMCHVRVHVRTCIFGAGRALLSLTLTLVSIRTQATTGSCEAHMAMTMARVLTPCTGAQQLGRRVGRVRLHLPLPCRRQQDVCRQEACRRRRLQATAHAAGRRRRVRCALRHVLPHRSHRSVGWL